MAYLVYLGKVLLPITPGKIDTKINNKNETIDLVNLGEVNILKDAGLSDVSLETLIPQVKYPFANYTDGFKDAKYYLDYLEQLKKTKEPFQFIVSRTTPSGKVLFHTNVKVSLEDYSNGEDAENGLDILVPIRLKHYKDYSSKKIVVNSSSNKPSGSVQTKRPDSNNKPSGKTYTVKPGDSLWSICKTQLGDGSKQRYEKVYQLNKEMIDARNKGKDVYKYTIYSGQVLRLE